MMMIGNLIVRKLATYIPRTVVIGGHPLALPAGHRLDWYRFCHRRLDEPVTELCTLLLKKYPKLFAVDIGANVGGTAAMMATSAQVSILCVEGNPAYLPKLRANLGRISPSSEIEPSYVWIDDDAQAGHVETSAGTASISLNGDAPHNSEAIRFRSLAGILSEHPRFQNARLFKIDTDGMDAKIIMASSDLLAKVRPIIFMEYLPIGPIAVERECRAMIERLRQLDYTQFHVFDNSGNHMLRLSGSETHHLHTLNAYVRSSRMDLKPAVYYYDICAMTEDDRDISEMLLHQYLTAA